jgi:hypothetical protein
MMELLARYLERPRHPVHPIQFLFNPFVLEIFRLTRDLWLRSYSNRWSEASSPKISLHPRFKLTILEFLMRPGRRHQNPFIPSLFLLRSK